ncbi:NUDIX domain-containing protein [Candidatus Woesebacteria bacterium]|nr:NUDIX domain-containing protein [Candidatus Woesebacteria bacterium]QQG47950.1 MAG: NUDIX domain-containing protein [Candidatus Woesebacteria bacterium]
MSGSSTLIIWGEKILLFHRDDTPLIPNPDCWSLPGGGIEKDETPLQAVKRELMEEVSYCPKNIKFLIEIKNKAHNSSYVYLSFVEDGEAKFFKHGPGEGQEIGFFSMDETLKLKLTPILRRYLIKFKKEIEEMMRNKITPK